MHLNFNAANGIRSPGPHWREAPLASLSRGWETPSLSRRAFSTNGRNLYLGPSGRKPLCEYWKGRVKQFRRFSSHFGSHFSSHFCPRRNKIPSRTIVLQAWVSSVVSCVSNLKDGIFSKRFELEGWNFLYGSFLWPDKRDFLQDKNSDHPNPPTPLTHLPPQTGSKG